MRTATTGNNLKAFRLDAGKQILVCKKAPPGAPNFAHF